MTLAPLLEGPLAVQIHAATVVPAFFLGAWQIFLSRKGAPAHRTVGFIYLALMTVTAIAALFVHQINPAGLSIIHIFVPVTLAGVAGALYGARTRNIALHRNFMIGTYAGGLVIAGAFALSPGRIMHAVLFW